MKVEPGVEQGDQAFERLASGRRPPLRESVHVGKDARLDLVVELLLAGEVVNDRRPPDADFLGHVFQPGGGEAHLGEDALRRVEDGLAGNLAARLPDHVHAHLLVPFPPATQSGLHSTYV
ncbi:hypothetical protein J4558_25145 [Leptolyngbya sp. 15MV]|nr:hypothetical protein J4558_25145 [Leptolyngbya sp. 15MV]